jgi:putative transposase
LKVLKAYKYKLKVNNATENKFLQIAGSCRFVCNLFLCQRKQEYGIGYVSPNYYDQAMQLPALKEEYPWLRDIPSQVLQHTLKDLDKAFENFFRRCKNGETPGYPKFKKRGNYDSFRYPQGVKLDGSKIFLPKIGWVKFIKSREVEGKIKNVTVVKKASGWYVSIQTEHRYGS